MKGRRRKYDVDVALSLTWTMRVLLALAQLVYLATRSERFAGWAAGLLYRHQRRLVQRRVVALRPHAAAAAVRR